jgi:hypothetical protein
VEPGSTRNRHGRDSSRSRNNRHPRTMQQRIYQVVTG